MVKRTIFHLLTFILILLFLTQNAFGWKESLQDGVADGWTGEFSLKTPSGETYTICLYQSATNTDLSDTAYSPDFGSSRYVSFRHVYAYRWNTYGGGFTACVLNESGVEKCCGLPVLNERNFLIEFVELNNYIYVFVNGNLHKDLGYLGGSIRKVKIRTSTSAGGLSHGYAWYVDDFSTSGYVVALAEQYNDHNATQFDDETIEVEWTVNLYYDKGKTFKILVRKLTTGIIVNETNISEIASEWGCGVVTYNRTELLGYDYGLYIFELTADGQLMDYDYLYYMPPGETSSLAFDKETYVTGETATITYDIANPDFSSHNYYIKILDIYGNEKKRWHITKESGSVTFNTNELDAGTYYAVLMQYSEPVDLAYDMMQVEERVDIEGVSYDAKSESVLGDVNVNASQGTVWHNTTTDTTTGYYNLTDFIVDEAIQMNASKANYTHNNFSFTPLQNGLYEINLYLLPDASHINITPPAVVGIVSEYPFHQAISNASVNIWKEGWNSNTTTNSMGYFEFILDNTSMNTSTIENETFNSSEYGSWVQLANTGIVPYTEKVTNTTDETPYVRGVDYEMDYVNGKIKVLSGGSMQNNTLYHIDYEKYDATTFSLNATKEGYRESETLTFTVNPTEIKYVYPSLYGLYNITVRARDASTHATIFNFKATLNDGEQTKETTLGWLNFTGVEYGIHKVEVGADGYYSAIEYVYVYGDIEKVIYLAPLEGEAEQGVGISYPPHQVEFACVDIFGNPLANVYVEATPISTTTGAWDWLLNLFGIRNESISYFINQTLNGTTDSRGAITFVMMENVEYEVRFVNESLGINKTIRIYPKADHYTVMLTPTTSSLVSSEDYITFNLSYEIVDDEINLSLTYNDTLNQTKNLTFFVYNSTTLLYQQNFTNTSNVSVSYTVSYKAGEEYMWGYSAYHSNFGNMGRSRILRIAWFLDLGISRTYCTWIAIAIILFLTAMFSFTTVKFGYVAIPMVSLIFAYIGWLPNISIIIIALCLGILAYMSKREKEVGV